MIEKTMLVLAVLAIGILTMPAYADVSSPLQQYKMGMPINEIQCNNDKVLMKSTSGKPACVFEDTAKKLENRGWEIIPQTTKEISTTEIYPRIILTTSSSDGVPALPLQAETQINYSTIPVLGETFTINLSTTFSEYWYGVDGSFEDTVGIRLYGFEIVNIDPVFANYSAEKYNGYDVAESSSSVNLTQPQTFQYIITAKPTKLDYTSISFDGLIGDSVKSTLWIGTDKSHYYYDVKYDFLDVVTIVDDDWIFKVHSNVEFVEGSTLLEDELDNGYQGRTIEELNQANIPLIYNTTSFQVDIVNLTPMQEDILFERYNNLDLSIEQVRQSITMYTILPTETIDSLVNQIPPRIMESQQAQQQSFGFSSELIESTPEPLTSEEEAAYIEEANRVKTTEEIEQEKLDFVSLFGELSNDDILEMAPWSVEDYTMMIEGRGYSEQQAREFLKELNISNIDEIITKAFAQLSSQSFLLIPAYADTMSPLKQYNMGIPINEIQCNNNKVLLQSPAGKPACVFEDTAIKLENRGWVILEDEINDVSLDSNVERYTVEEYFGNSEPQIPPYADTNLVLIGTPKVGETGELVMSTVYEIIMAKGEVLDENGDYIFDENGYAVVDYAPEYYHIEDPLISMRIYEGDGINYRVTNIVSNVNTGDPDVFAPYDADTQAVTAIIGYPYVVKGTVEILQEGFHRFTGTGLQGDVSSSLNLASGYDKSNFFGTYVDNGDTYLDHTLPVIGSSEDLPEPTAEPVDPPLEELNPSNMTATESQEQWDNEMAAWHIEQESSPKDVFEELVHHEYTIQEIRAFLENKMNFSSNVVDDLISTLPDDYHTPKTITEYSEKKLLSTTVTSDVGRFYIEDFSFTYPETVVVGEPFEVTVSATTTDDVPDDYIGGFYIILSTGIDVLDDNYPYKRSMKDGKTGYVENYHFGQEEFPTTPNTPFTDTIQFDLTEDTDSPYPYLLVTPYSSGVQVIKYLVLDSPNTYRFVDERPQIVLGSSGVPFKNQITLEELEAMPEYQAMDHDGPPVIGDYFADFLRYEVTDMTPLEFLTYLNFTSEYIDKVFEAYPDLKTQTADVSGVSQEKINIEDNNELTTQNTNENHTPKLITKNKSSSQITAPDDDSNTIPISDEIKTPKLGAKHSKELEKIPNPDGYWVPIVDKDAFAEHFLSVVGDEIIDIEDKFTYTGDYYSRSYKTVNGFLDIEHDPLFNERFASVTYRSLDIVYDMPKQMEYVNNFMNKIGFKMNGSDVALSESFIDNCTKYVPDGYYCEIGDGYIGISPWLKYGSEYSLTQEHGNMSFIFFNKAYYYASEFGIEINFHGWTNHPELVKSTMDQKSTIDGVIAVQKAYDFALNNEELNKSHRDGGTCEYKLREIMLGEGADKNLIIISGVPYYMVFPGLCTYDPRNTGHIQFPLIVVDAWTGDSIFLTYVGGLD